MPWVVAALVLIALGAYALNSWRARNAEHAAEKPPTAASSEPAKLDAQSKDASGSLAPKTDVPASDEPLKDGPTPAKPGEPKGDH